VADIEEHADLDIILRWTPEANGFNVTMLYNAPRDIEDAPYLGERPLRFPLEELQDIRDDVKAYGQRLGDVLFADQARVLLDRAMLAAESIPVDMRLLIDSKAPFGYQAIRWETMRRPGSGEPLTTSGNIRFCRSLSNAEGRQATPLARQGNLRALVAVANPADIGDYAAGAARLAAIEVDEEVARARRALANMTVTVLPVDGLRATRAGIIDALREGYHALYLVCHGRIPPDGSPELFLEDSNGEVDLVLGADFAEDMAGLRQVPTIAVLCSCQSGGPIAEMMTSTAESLTATGPAIANAGATVVVAMQGNVTMATAARFLERFFEELDGDGLPARAMAVARSTIRDRPDWYMPVLYSRLKRGSAWYRPRFGGRESKLFRNLHTRIRRHRSTPIIGSGVAREDGVMPSRQEIAKRWAEARQMPLSVASQGDMASVAQYVSVEDRGGYQLARDELDQLLRRDLKAMHAHELGDLDWRNGGLHDLVRSIGEHRRRVAGAADCYVRLARLELPVYVTSSWTFLLEDALTDAGKSPLIRHFNWYQRRQLSEDIDEEDEEDVAFDADHPLVYHLFGTLEVERSLVLTEDDYFAWLREWMKQVDKGVSIPNYLKPPLMENSLLFLGYVFDDWEFRMILQAVKGFQGDLLRDTTHVGVQLQPETLRIEREAAQEYLESYLGLDNLDIYWGTSGTFLKELEESRPRDE
jgi:hypothetical protein